MSYQYVGDETTKHDGRPVIKGSGIGPDSHHGGFPKEKKSRCDTRNRRMAKKKERFLKVQEKEAWEDSERAKLEKSQFKRQVRRKGTYQNVLTKALPAMTHTAESRSSKPVTSTTSPSLLKMRARKLATTPSDHELAAIPLTTPRGRSGTSPSHFADSTESKRGRYRSPSPDDDGYYSNPDADTLPPSRHREDDSFFDDWDYTNEFRLFDYAFPPPPTPRLPDSKESLELDGKRAQQTERQDTEIRPLEVQKAELLETNQRQEARKDGVKEEKVQDIFCPIPYVCRCEHCESNIHAIASPSAPRRAAAGVASPTKASSSSSSSSSRSSTTDDDTSS